MLNQVASLDSVNIPSENSPYKIPVTCVWSNDDDALPPPEDHDPSFKAAMKDPVYGHLWKEAIRWSAEEQTII